MIRAVLFDAAGTLIDLREPVGKTYAETAARHGVTVSAEIVEDAFYRILAQSSGPPPDGPTLDERRARERQSWHRIVRSTFLAADSTLRFDDFEAFFADLYAHYGTCKAWILRPGAAACLDGLRTQGVRVGLLSNFDHRLPEILEGLGIARFFSSVMLPSNTGARKPGAAAFQNATEALGIEPANTLFVGNDPEIDRDGARACGLKALLVGDIEPLAEFPSRLAAAATLAETLLPPK